MRSGQEQTGLILWLLGSVHASHECDAYAVTVMHVMLVNNAIKWTHRRWKTLHSSEHAMSTKTTTRQPVLIFTTS